MEPVTSEERREVSHLPVPEWIERVVPPLLDAGFEHVPLMGHDLAAVMWLHGRALCWLRTTAADNGLSHLELVRVLDTDAQHTDTRVRFGLLIDLVDASHVHVEVRQREWRWDSEADVRETRRTLERTCELLEASMLFLPDEKKETAEAQRT